jgi:hypothetical protein
LEANWNQAQHEYNRYNRAPEHPHTDGNIERFIGAIAGMIRARAIKDGRDWDIWIPAL